jgi:hypothetical protein
LGQGEIGPGELIGLGRPAYLQHDLGDLMERRRPDGMAAGFEAAEGADGQATLAKDGPLGRQAPPLPALGKAGRPPSQRTSPYPPERPASKPVPAIVTFLVDDAQIPATHGAPPPVLLLPQPVGHANVPDPEQILDHAHLVIAHVTLVELPEIGAGELVTLETERDLSPADEGTIPLDPGALFVLHPAPLASVL